MQGQERVVITVSGEAGTGKTSTAKAVAKKLGFHFFSAGTYARELAHRHEVNIEHQAKFANATIDDLVDGATKENADKHKQVVLDGRIAHIFFPDAIKIYITCPLEVRAERRAKDNNISQIKAWRELVDRDAADRGRLQKLRGVNFQDQSQYSAVFTSTKSKEEVVAEVIDFINRTLSQSVSV